MLINRSHQLLFSVSTSSILIAFFANASLAQQINNQNQGHITVSGPIYNDSGSGAWESLISNGSNNSIKIIPTTGRVTAGTARMEGGSGLIAADTDFIGGARTGAVVLARDHYAAGAYIELTNSTITATETVNESRGLETRHTASASMNGGYIISRLTNNIDPVGVLAWSGGGRPAQGDLASITVNDIKAFISDTAGTASNATGARSVDGGQIFISDSEFIIGHIDNNYNKGIEAAGVTNKLGHEGAASFVNSANNVFTVSGDASFGAKLENSGSLKSTNTIFNVVGDDSVGVYVGNDSIADIDGGKIFTSGINAIGTALYTNAIATLSNTTIESNGVVTSIFADPSSPSSIILSVQNSILIGNNAVFNSDGANSSITINDSRATTSGLLINAENETNLNLEADNSWLVGDVNTDANSYINLNLKNAAELTGAINASQSLLSIDTNSRWHIGGDSNFANLINNGSVFFPDISNEINLQSSYTTISITDYHGGSGSIHFNTYLGGDSSATDKLITNTVTGTTTVIVNNTGGLGQQTVEGIHLIISPNSSHDAFKLSGDYTSRGSDAVIAGAYAYRLHQGNTSGSNTTDWFLRSELIDTTPEYQAGAPLYEAYPQLLLGLNALPTMQQRVGNRYWNNAGNRSLAQGADIVESYVSSSESGAFIQNNGIWGRIEGGHTKIKPRLSTSETSYDYDSFKFQAGLDGMLNETDAGKLIGGFTVHYTHGKMDVESVHGNGDIKTDGYGFGGTLTWYGDNGFYIDGQGQLTWYRSDLYSSTAKKSLAGGKNNGFGYALSVEAGQRVTIDDHWSVTPQAQLQYSNVDFNDFTTHWKGGKTDIALDKGDSLRGRLSISLDYQNAWQNDHGMTNRSVVYGIANLYNEFLDGTKVNVSGKAFANKQERFWGGIGLGGSYNWDNDKYSIYGEASVNTSFKNFGDSNNYKGTLGVRVKW